METTEQKFHAPEQMGKHAIFVGPPGRHPPSQNQKVRQACHSASPSAPRNEVSCPDCSSVNIKPFLHSPLPRPGCAWDLEYRNYGDNVWTRTIRCDNRCKKKYTAGIRYPKDFVLRSRCFSEKPPAYPMRCLEAQSKKRKYEEKSLAEEL